MNKKLIFSLKLLLSLIILYFLFKNIDVKQSIKMFINVNPIVFISMIIIYLSGQWLSAYKWSLISNNLGFNYNLSQYTSYYFTGMFFNLFLPTSVGGDATKAYYLYKGESKTSKMNAFFSVFADRLTGVFVLIFICFIGLFFSPAEHLPIYVKSVIMLVFVTMLLSLLICPKIINKFYSGPDKIWKKSLIKIVLISIIFHCFMIVIHFCIGRTMGLNIPISYYLIIYPITAIIGLIPISVNGVGIRDAAYIYLFSAILINPEQSLAFSFCWFAVTFISSTFGAIFYLKNKTSLPKYK